MTVNFVLLLNLEAMTQAGAMLLDSFIPIARNSGLAAGGRPLLAILRN